MVVAFIPWKTFMNLLWQSNNLKVIITNSIFQIYWIKLNLNSAAPWQEQSGAAVLQLHPPRIVNYQKDGKKIVVLKEAALHHFLKGTNG